MKLFNKYGMRMMTEFEEGGGGSGEEGGETPVTPEAKPTASLDPKAFAEEFGSVIAKQFSQREEKQQNRPPTAEERAAARKQFGMVDIDDEFLTQFDNLETRKTALQKYTDRIYESMGNIQAAQLAQLNRAWEEKFTPVQNMLTQREETERVSRFHKSYPQLADENMAPVISGIGQKLAEQGAFKGLSEIQAFDVLAKGVESVIKHHNPQFTLTKNGGKSSNEIPVETSGGRGGGGNAGASVKADSPNGLFGPVRTSKR